VVTTATDLVLYAAGVFPSPGRDAHGPFGLSAAHQAVYGVGGSYLTARLAPDRPLQHALALGCLGVALSTAGAIAMWDAAPPWFSLTAIAMALPVHGRAEPFVSAR
jgi:hypothetical protein